MGQYVDGFLIPIPRENVDRYREIAQRAGRIWREHGALAYHEWIGDDLEGAGTVSFLNAAEAGDGETVILAWIVYESRAHRDEVNAAVMSDPRIAEMMELGFQPFDQGRLVYGGFETLVAL